MNYLKFKILFCSQFEKEIFAIINIHDTIRKKHKLLAFSFPSWHVEINNNININDKNSLKSIISQVVVTNILENISLYNSYEMKTKISGVLPLKIKKKNIEVEGNSVCVMINGETLKLKINSIDFLKDNAYLHLSCGFYTNTSFIIKDIVETSYYINFNLVSLIKSKIQKKDVIKTFNKAFLSSIKYIKLREYDQRDTLSSMGEYTLKYLSYNEIEKYVTLDMLGDKTMENMTNFNLLYDSLS
ncbi:MAG: hypothetical protein IKT40_11565 [Bacilli bacterium]|nr:hypothetical protein [Bacilli bacterium]